MKEVKDKTNKSRSHLPTKLVINKNVVTSKTDMANECNKFFKYISPELTRKIPTESRKFESFLNNIDATMVAESITVSELRQSFFP